MAADRNNVSRLGGQYMVQDRDHVSEANELADTAKRGNIRQAEQSQSGGGQQGGGDHSASRKQGEQRRQAH
jgi:hypothetical protein